jgi:hypothetical protein
VRCVERRDVDLDPRAAATDSDLFELLETFLHGPFNLAPGVSPKPPLEPDIAECAACRGALDRPGGRYCSVGVVQKPIDLGHVIST